MNKTFPKVSVVKMMQSLHKEPNMYGACTRVGIKTPRRNVHNARCNGVLFSSRSVYEIVGVKRSRPFITSSVRHSSTNLDRFAKENSQNFKKLPESSRKLILKKVKNSFGINEATLIRYNVGFCYSENGLDVDPGDPGVDSQSIKDGELSFPFYGDSDETPAKLEVHHISFSSLENETQERIDSTSLSKEIKSTQHLAAFGWKTLKKNTKRNKVYVTCGINAAVNAMIINQELNQPAVALSDKALNAKKAAKMFSRFDKVLLVPSEKVEQLNDFAKELGSKVSLVREEPRPGNHLEFANPCEILKKKGKKGLEDLLTASNEQSFQPTLHSNIISREERLAQMEEYITNPPSTGTKPKNFIPGMLKSWEGLRMGEMTVFTGGTGSGKTTFLSQLSLSLALSHVHVLWGSFEIKPQRLQYQMVDQLFAISASDNAKFAEKLEKGELNDAAELDAEAKLKSMRHLIQLPLDISGAFGGIQIGEWLELCKQAVTYRGVELIIMDNLQFMMSGSTRDEKFDQMDEAVGKVREFATKYNVHVILVVHPRKEEGKLTMNSFAGSARTTQEADNVMILHRDKEKRSIQIAKNRFSGKTCNVPLQFNPVYRMYIEAEPEPNN